MASFRSMKLCRLPFAVIRNARYQSTSAEVHVSHSSNVDQKEIENLSKQSADWWNPNGSIRGLHSMNALRVPLIRDGLISTGIIDRSRYHQPNVLAGINVLEVGCGGGILTEALARIRANVVGIDPSEQLIAVAKEHTQKDANIAAQVQYHVETVEQHAEKHPECYDAVVISEVLEHVNNKISFLENCIATLKPGGSIFITTLNKTTASWLGAIVAAEQIFQLVPEGTHDWEKFIAPLDVERILNSYSCKTALVHGMGYQFWANRWCWSRSTEINYAMHAVKVAES